MFSLSFAGSPRKTTPFNALLLGLTSSAAFLASSWQDMALAQQVLANGTTETATGVVDTGTTTGIAGIGLRATNNGTIESDPPLIVITRGDNAIGAQATSNSKINLSGGTVIHTTGSQADGIVSSDAGSVVTATGTDVLTDNTGYGIIAGSGGQIEMTKSYVRALVGTGARVETGGKITLNDSNLETGTGLALWVTANSSIIGDGLAVTSRAERGAVVQSGILSLTRSSIFSSSIGIQTATGATVTLNDTTVSTTGSSAYGVYLSGGSTLTIDGGSISTVGSGSRALYGGPDTNTATIAGARITSSQSSAIFAFGATAIFNVDLIDSSITGNPSALEIGSGATLNLDASNSEMTGAVITSAGSTSNVALFDGTVWNLTGNSNITALSNDDSLIQFSDPTGGAYKTLTAVNYAGNTGRIGLNTYLAADGSPSDLLIINGGAATGSTGLLISDTTGGGALTTGNGILVVDTINGGITDPASFHLAGPAVAGPYDYSLYRSSLDGSGPQNWYLRSNLSPSPPGPGPEPTPTPDYRPEVSLYAAIPAMAAIYGRHLIDTLHERVGEQEQLEGRSDLGKGDTFDGFWMRGIGHWGHRNGDPRGIYDGAPEFDYRFGALKGGLDFYREEKDDFTDHAGMYLAYGRGVMDVTQDRLIETRDAGRNDFNAFSVGGYWTRFGETGWYLDGVLQGTWYDVTTKSNRATEFGFPDQDIDGFGFAASLEGGYPFDLGNGWQLEPQAQIVWQTVHMDDFNDGAADIRYDNLNSLAGRIGARIARTWEAEAATASEPARLATVWGRVNLWHEFTAKAQTDISSANGFVPFSTDLDETWIELGVGGTREVSNNTSLYGNVGFSTTFDGDNYAWNGKIGLRVNW